MPQITDIPPQNVQNDLDSLSAALDLQIPAKQEGANLLIATWNIRAFSSLTRQWTASSSQSPKRDLRGLRAIIEVLSRFDVIAIQEAKGNLRALRDTLRFLGDDWSFLMTDITAGNAGNSERMAFLFDRRRVRPSGLAAEIVVPPEWTNEVGEDALTTQFARTPYAVSFRAGDTTFILVTLHVDYGKRPEDRRPELAAIARWMDEWASRSTKWHQNLLALGDFNIDRKGDDLYQAFTSTGLTVPPELNSVPRSIFASATSPSSGKYYDQIAWFTSGSRRRLDMDYVTAGGFDFLPHVYTDAGLSKASISFRMSDHYPLWSEFGIG